MLAFLKKKSPTTSKESHLRLALSFFFLAGRWTRTGDRRLRDATVVLGVPDAAASLHGNPCDLQSCDHRHRDRYGRGLVISREGLVLPR